MSIKRDFSRYPLVSGEAALLFKIARDENQNGLVNDEVKAAITDGVQLVPVYNSGCVNFMQAFSDLTVSVALGKLND